jgi:hypothetical protein
VVIEGGFDCPEDLPFLIEVEGGVICASSDPGGVDGVPDEVCLGVLGIDCRERMPGLDAGRPDTGPPDAGRMDGGEPDAGGPSREGRIVYVSTESGTAELWAMLEDLSSPVRLTEGMTASVDSTGVRLPRTSPDGEHVAVLSVRDSAGMYGVTPHLWVMEADGSRLTHVAQIGLSGRGDGWHPFDWEPDSRHVLFSVQVSCSEDLWRADIGDPAAAVRVYDIADIVTAVRVSPRDPNDILFVHSICAVGGTLTRLDLAMREETPVFPAGVGAFWMPDGLRYLLRSDVGRIVIRDFAGVETLVYDDPDPMADIVTIAVSPDGTRVAVGYSRPGLPVELATIEIAAGELTATGFALDPASPYIEWVDLRTGIDRDGDGLANGIDPTPDG